MGAAEQCKSQYASSRLMYFSKEYEGWLSANQKYIYGEKLVKIPAPKFYVLYNGEEQMPEREEYRLTDAFEHPSPGYEWTAYVVNINSGIIRS